MYDGVVFEVKKEIPASMSENTADTAPEVRTAEITSEALGAYFASIEEPFRETRVEMSPGGRSFKTLVVVVFIFSLIPFFPYILARYSSHILIRSVTLWNVRISFTSFWFWWIALFVISLLLLIATFKFSGPSKEQKDKWLSSQQMRFAYCYAVVNEIRNYRTNHLMRHIKAASEDFERAATAVLGLGALDIGDGIYLSQGQRLDVQFSQSPMVGFHPVRPYWYKLEPETKDILRALLNFGPKVGERLKDRRDLSIIEAALVDLAGYFYTEIPEISDGTDDTALRNLGTACLVKFSAKINELPAYRSEQQSQTSEEKISRKVVSTGQRLSTLFNNENLLVAFVAWYLLLLVLFLTGFYLALHYIPGVKVDSTMITAIVGGPIATAITAVTIPRFSKGKKHDE